MAQQPALDVDKALFVILLEPSQQVAKFPYRGAVGVDGGGVSGTSGAAVVGSTSDISDGRRRRRQRLQHLVEAVHVELADKRRHVAVLEVAGQRRGKLLVGMEQEGVVLGVVLQPPDEVGEPRVLEHRVELVDKGVLFHGWLGFSCHGSYGSLVVMKRGKE